MKLWDKGVSVYEIFKSPIYVGTKHGRGGGDYFTDPVLQVQSIQTNKLPLKVTKRFPPIKKLKTDGEVHRWSYGAGYGESGDINELLTVFKQAGYPIVRTEQLRNQFGRPYTLYFVANIGGK